jgi:hypothetical protein
MIGTNGIKKKELIAEIMHAIINIFGRRSG